MPSMKTSPLEYEWMNERSFCDGNVTLSLVKRLIVNLHYFDLVWHYATNSCKIKRDTYTFYTPFYDHNKTAILKTVNTS